MKPLAPDELEKEGRPLLSALNTALQPCFYTARMLYEGYHEIGMETEAEGILAPLTPQARKLTLTDPPIPQETVIAMSLPSLAALPGVLDHPFTLGRLLERMTHVDTPIPTIDREAFARGLSTAHGMLDPEDPTGAQVRQQIEGAFVAFGLGDAPGQGEARVTRLGQSGNLGGASQSTAPAKPDIEKA
jgi:hypothetical protein